jgi:TM2 domain-containing membrane protein YozV
LNREITESDASWLGALLLSFFGGWLGVDRLYLGSFWLGLLKLCTVGGLFVWWGIDVLLLCCGAMKDGEGRKVRWRRS